MSTRTVTVTMHYTPRRRWSPRRHQGWRWTAQAANGKVLAVSSESYANRGDCRAAVTLLFGYATAVILRDAEMPEHYCAPGSDRERARADGRRRPARHPSDPDVRRLHPHQHVMSVRVAAVATQLIGLLWVVLAALYRNDHDDTIRDMSIGFVVAATGFAVWLIAGWWEGRS